MLASLAAVYGHQFYGPGPLRYPLAAVYGHLTGDPGPLRYRSRRAIR